MKVLLAYLDPGSGSALVGTLIAVAGSALYSMKSVFYRLISKKTASSLQLETPTTIAIFSEGKNYWNTWRLIVEELLSRKVHFAYYTMDLHDPALLIDSEYMHAKLYDKNKAASYQHLSKIKARALLSTSPNIGTPGFPIKRSEGVVKMLHVFHAFADISAYHQGSLDNYDVVLTVGPHQEKYIREVEVARNLKAKRMIPVGLPYFDAQYLKKTECSRVKDEQRTRKTILIAPSWGSKGCLNEYGIGFVKELAEAGYDVIVRPHPQSYIAEPDFIAKCVEATLPYPNVVWDRETVGLVSMEKSDILISDTSSIRFDYAFLYGKPVITLDIPKTSQQEYDGVYQKVQWVDVAAPKLGAVLNHDTIGMLTDKVKELTSTLQLQLPTPTITNPTSTSPIVAFRNETISNLGTSAKVIVDVLVKEAANV